MQQNQETREKRFNINQISENTKETETEKLEKHKHGKKIQIYIFYV